MTKNYNRVTRIDSPLMNLKELTEFHNTKLKNYNLTEMYPKVTYDDWIVCYYKINDKLYYITKDDIKEVNVVAVINYDNNFEPVDSNGNIITEELADYYDCLCCGEADDCSCYVYFE